MFSESWVSLTAMSMSVVLSTAAGSDQSICSSCHNRLSRSEPSDSATWPAEDRCVGCHGAIVAEAPSLAGERPESIRSGHVS